MSADLTVQPADAVDGAAAPYCQVRHIKWLGGIRTISPPERQQILHRNREASLRVLLEIPLHQARRETVKARCHGSVGGKKITGARDRKCHVEWLLVVGHVRAGALQHRERGMTLIEVAYLRLQSESPQELPAADPQYELLLQAQLRTASVELGRDAAIRRNIRGVVCVKQIQLRSTHLHLPGADPKLAGREVD